MKILFVGNTHSHRTLREAMCEHSDIFYLMNAKKAIQDFEQLSKGFEWLVFDNRILRGNTNPQGLTSLMTGTTRHKPQLNESIWYGYHESLSKTDLER